MIKAIIKKSWHEQAGWGSFNDQTIAVSFHLTGIEKENLLPLPTSLST
jgi:hypothetical protein